MRVAILGAGLAGLACAYELERLGIRPVIFEKRHRVGERFPNVEIMPQILHHRPSRDIFLELRQHLGLPLQPSGAITRVTLHGPSRAVTAQGHIGYFTIRGHDDRSLERQLQRHLKAEIRFRRHPHPDRLAREFDRVVVATGDQEVTRALGLWQRDLAGWLRGAVVRGDFDPSGLHIWFRTEYAKSGYGYLAPFDERRAFAMVAVPDSNAEEVDRYWQRFLRAEGAGWKVEREAKLEKFEIGQAAAHTVGPLLLVGNAGGFVEPLVGCGQCPSLYSGVMAAREIALGDGSLTRFARRWRGWYRRLLRVRRWLSEQENSGFDRLVGALSLPGARTALFRSPLPLIAPAGALLGALGLGTGPIPEPGHQQEPGPSPP